ncbi:recombinase family protein [Streptomyces fractus]|uniref:recombinase family protein n=1 Tax=Streptomyces fractus TaxID=641806 RepID=UPI003CF6A444
MLTGRGELQWLRPSRAVLQNMLRHPIYAGVYVYGRSRTDPRRRREGRPFTGRVRRPREDWLVYLPDTLPAYIGIERHERNLARLEANKARSESMGALRDGPALLGGLIFCGQCGTRMTVRYQRALSPFLVAASSRLGEEALAEETCEAGASDVDQCLVGGHAEEFVQLTRPELPVGMLVEGVHDGLVGAVRFGRFGGAWGRCEFRDDLPGGRQVGEPCFGLRQSGGQLLDLVVQFADTGCGRVVLGWRSTRSSVMFTRSARRCRARPGSGW